MAQALARKQLLKVKQEEEKKKRALAVLLLNVFPQCMLFAHHFKYVGNVQLQLKDQFFVTDLKI